MRNIAHRLLGVAEVRVETGGGQEPEATISVLHETVFEEMRRRIFEGRTRAKATALVEEEAKPEVAPAVESRTLLHLPLRELLLHGVLDNRGMFVIAAAYGALWETGLFRLGWNQFANGWYGPGLVSDTVRTIISGRVPSLGRIAIIVVGIVGLLMLVRVLSMAWSGTRLYDFRLSHVGEDLRTEYGLLTRVTATIPLRRIQALTIRETPLQRLLSRMSVRVDTAGGRATPEQGPKQPRELLAPIIRADAVPTLVREVLPGIALDSLDWQPLHPRAFRRTLKALLLLATAWSVGLVALAGWAGWVAFPFTFAVLAAGSWKHVQHMQWAINEDVLGFRSGWLWRTVTVVPVVKIQTVGCTESPFDRRTAMASVRVDTAGSAMHAHRIGIPYLARETARTLYERLSAQAAQTAFRW